jgi:hypothetical protein
MTLVIVASVLGALCVLGCVFVVVFARRVAALRDRFKPILDVETEVARMRSQASADADRLRADASHELGRARHDAERHVADARQTAERLRADTVAEQHRARQEAERHIANAHQLAERVRNDVQAEAQRREQMAQESARVRLDLDRLKAELRSVEENVEDVSFGVYKPHYRFDTPDEFKAELQRVNEKQKEMIRSGEAASSAVEWTVGNSKKEGEKMQKQYSKLMLRAFNGESDAAIAKVSWNNIGKMEERLRKAFDSINALGGVMTVSIAPKYRDLKLQELRLEYELEERKREIAEEQRRIREQMKEEERALREAEKAQAEAEAEENRYQRALEKAKVELSKARGEEHSRMSEKILELEQQLVEAHAKTVRAKSMAELTKAGYVYVLSNIGSFGEEVFKIGMTRRLDPMDRVKELGDASVPFPFDVHAMVYSEDAPGLECLFHQEFRDRSVNLVNMRKEFFSVGLDEIEAFARARGLKIAFTKLAEAREYRESLSLREERPRTRQGSARPRRESVQASFEAHP